MGVDLTLSTAQPLLNATPPELAQLDIGIAPRTPNQAINVNGVNNFGKNTDDNKKQAEAYRNEAQQLGNSGQKGQAYARWNDAAALQQSDEIINADAAQIKEQQAKRRAGGGQEGQSVTFHLDRRFSIPWRDDEQLIEVTRLPLKPDYFYKAVPVLTSHVYRLANLTNDSKFVLLPGEATMYIGKDFVGRATLPLVAVGEEFTAGFGVDPQLQVTRQLMDKTRNVQGGNQVIKLQYRITLSSYKQEKVQIQVWDRLPHSEAEAVNVTLGETTPALSKDATYARQDKPKNLLRWDMSLDKGTNGEKATNIDYSFQLEFDKNAAIGNFLTK